MSVLARSLCAVAVFLVVASTAVAAPTPTINEFGDGVITNNAAATGIALGPDGNLYVTEFGTAGNRMARVAPDGTVTELPQFPTATAGAQNVALGPDGRMYVTEANVGKIAVFSPSDPSAIQEFATPTTNSQPHEIAVGPDGKLARRAPPCSGPSAQRRHPTFTSFRRAVSEWAPSHTGW
jgi:hypothetical protein